MPFIYTALPHRRSDIHGSVLVIADIHIYKEQHAFVLTFHSQCLKIQKF